jgi:hypothetical protein
MLLGAITECETDLGKLPFKFKQHVWELDLRIMAPELLLSARIPENANKIVRAKGILYILRQTEPHAETWNLATILNDKKRNVPPFTFEVLQFVSAGDSAKLVLATTAPKKFDIELPRDRLPELFIMPYLENDNGGSIPGAGSGEWGRREFDFNDIKALNPTKLRVSYTTAITAEEFSFEIVNLRL